MRIPRDSVIVEQTPDGVVARTSLLAGIEGRGNSERDAVHNLGWAVRAYLKRAHALGIEVPPPFRISPRRRVLLVTLFILAAIFLPALAIQFWRSLCGPGP